MRSCRIILVLAAALLVMSGCAGERSETAVLSSRASASAAPERIASPTPALFLEVGGRRLHAVPEDNPSASAFLEKLSAAPLTLEMEEYGGFEKVADLPWSLPQSDERITTSPGDVILYQGDKLTLYYGQNTWTFTRLARVVGVSGEELRALLGEGSARVKWFVEWSE